VTISELSRDELKRLIGEAVEEKLIELLGDPDERMVLREEVQARLHRTLEAERAGRRGVPPHGDEEQRQQQQSLTPHVSPLPRS